MGSPYNRAMLTLRTTVSLALRSALLLPLLGCAAAGPQAGHPQAPAPAAASTGPAAPSLNLENLYVGGRYAELRERVARAQLEAARQAPDVVGLLLAAEGHPGEALRTLRPLLEGRAGSQRASARCLPLAYAQIAFYQRGDAAEVARALAALDGDGASGPCAEPLFRQAAAALRARAAALPAGRAWSINPPEGEQVLAADRIASNAGYLVVRAVFDRDRSAQLLLTMGPDMIIDRSVADRLGLKVDGAHPTPAALLPGLPADLAPGGGLDAAVIPRMRLGLTQVRDVPVLVADLSALRERFRLRIAREVALDGLLPLHRVVRRGYFRVLRRGTELRLAASGDDAGPCRLSYPASTPLHQQAGALLVEAALPGGPGLLFGLDPGRRFTSVRGSALRYASPAPRVSQAPVDVARPPVTEEEVTQRLADVTLSLGQAQLVMRHVPLLASAQAPPGMSNVHGAIGADVTADMDLMVDVGDGRLYLGPTDPARCR